MLVEGNDDAIERAAHGFLVETLEPLLLGGQSDD
jgi:hypothetical protein